MKWLGLIKKLNKKSVLHWINSKQRQNIILNFISIPLILLNLAFSQITLRKYVISLHIIDSLNLSTFQFN